MSVSRLIIAARHARKDPRIGSRSGVCLFLRSDEQRQHPPFARMTHGASILPSVIPDLIGDPESFSCLFVFVCHPRLGEDRRVLPYLSVIQLPLRHPRPRSGIQSLSLVFLFLSVIPDPDRGSRVFAFSCVHEENGHWILAFARMTEGKGKDDRRRRCRHYNYQIFFCQAMPLSSPTPIGDPGCLLFPAFTEEPLTTTSLSDTRILAFARMTEGKGKDDRRRRCRHYNYLSVIPDPDRGSRVFLLSFCFCLSSPTPIGDPGCLLFPAFMKRTDTGSSRSQG